MRAPMQTQDEFTTSKHPIQMIEGPRYPDPYQTVDRTNWSFSAWISVMIIVRAAAYLNRGKLPKSAQNTTNEKMRMAMKMFLNMPVTHDLLCSTRSPWEL